VFCLSFVFFFFFFYLKENKFPFFTLEGFLEKFSRGQLRGGH